MGSRPKVIIYETSRRKTFSVDSFRRGRNFDRAREKKQDPNAGNSHVAECSKTRIRARPVVGAEPGANFSGPLARCHFLLVLDDAVAS